MVSKYLVWSKKNSHFFVSFSYILLLRLRVGLGRLGIFGVGGLWVYLKLRTSMMMCFASLSVSIPFELWIHRDTSFLVFDVCVLASRRAGVYPINFSCLCLVSVPRGAWACMWAVYGA